jgi:hypothetical protein
MLLAAGLLGPAAAALAQVSLPAVGITAKRSDDALPRVDVATVCPGYGEQLTQGLEMPAVEAPVEMVVLFRLEAGEVKQPMLRGGPWDYRHQSARQVRVAMHRVEGCHSDEQANQRFAFLLRVLPEAQGGTQTAALAPDAPQLLALRSER